MARQKKSASQERSSPTSPLPLPQCQDKLLGHQSEEQLALSVWRTGHIPHAWLLSGCSGIGKATFAYRFARFLFHQDLNNATHPPIDTLFVPKETPSFQWVAANSHPDLFVLECGTDPKTGKPKQEISITEVRKCITFLAGTPVASHHRIVIIDSIDALNKAGSNALLKVLEEPPNGGLLFLLTHHPGNVLKTLRSRCFPLKFSPLSLENTLAVLNQSSNLRENHNFDWCIIQAKGSPGKALSLLSGQATTHFHEFFRIFNNLPIDPIRLERLASEITSSPHQDDFEQFCALFLQWLSQKSLDAVQKTPQKAMMLSKAYEAANTWLQKTRLFNLDHKQALLYLFALYQKAEHFYDRTFLEI